MIVGTAGHIDHGKTSLVRALTGVDTDRLKEEKARGITIELGFAYLPRASGKVLGFVDVPGHERLVHTMLAGATGMDCVLLVIAADDGVMPQTREHLAIIELLGIAHGIVALTKCDLVAAERLAEVAAEIRTLLAATPLADAAIMPVSVVTGQGVAELLHGLDALDDSRPSRALDSRFRLAIDRSFSLPGAGTIVTGTVISGRVAVGDRMVVSPAGIEARVRSVHAGNRASTSGAAGQRCALALAGAKVDTESVVRGDVVVDPTLHAPVKRFDASVRLLATEKRAIGQWMPVKLHHGSMERDARILALDERSVRPGESNFAQIVLDRPAAVLVGDRYVLRDAGATRTIGGGVVLDLHPPERQRRSPARRAELLLRDQGDARAVLCGLLDGERGFVDLDAFYRDRALPITAVDVAIAALDLVVFNAGGARVAMARARWRRFSDEAAAHLAGFHIEKPDLPGLGQERLRLALSPRLPAPAFAVALQTLVADGRVVLDRSWVRLPGHEVRLSDDEERLWSRIVPLLSGAERFRPPRVRDVAKVLRIDEAFVRRLFKLAARRGDVDEIAQDHFFLAATVVEMADIARALALAGDGGEFNVIAFRDRLDNGRKVAIQILEFFDRQGLTMRRGDIRRINPHKAELFSSAMGVRCAPAAGDGGVPLPVGRPDFKSGEGRETALGGFDSCLLRQSSERHT